MRSGLAMTLAWMAMLVVAPFAHARKPNIVFILADDLGYGDIGCYGQKEIATPNIDRLAKEGMRFTSFYAGATVCAPSRYTLMTGMNNGHAAVRGNGGGNNANAKGGGIIPKDVPTVAMMLKDAGYATGVVGKWGLGGIGSGSLPSDKGFDFAFGYLNHSHAHNYYPDWLVRNGERIAIPGNTLKAPKKANGSGVAIQRETYSPDLFQKEAIEFIDKHKAEPFFLYYATTIPHANNENAGHGSEVPSLGQYEKKSWPENERGFAAMITYLDTLIGQLLDKLKADGIADDTIVIFTSDNGPHHEGGHDAKFFKSGGPLRGTKRDLYEGGIREPMIVRWPGHVKAGSETDFAGYFGDFYATAAEITGGKAPANLQSVSFLPTLLGQGDQKQHDALYWEFYERETAQAVRFGKWKAVRSPMLTGEIELFDLETDLGESKDIAGAHPEEVKRAEAIMKSERVVDPNWLAPSEMKDGEHKVKKKKGDVEE